MTPPREIAILGAGLAGLSLACAMLEVGVKDPITLLDRRIDWGRDRTWCTWATEPLRFSEVANHRWPEWRIVAGGRAGLGRSSAHPYLHLDARDVYGTALERLEAAPNVTVRPGIPVRGVDADGRRTVVRCGGESVEADLVFDALGPFSPLLEEPAVAPLELTQHFLGWEIEADRPVFDPAVATLMDFRSADRHGVRFLYVLPFSPTRALIEDTTLGRDTVPAEERRDALRTELSGTYGLADWEVRYEEQGRVPMSTRTYPLSHRGVHAVGASAGAIRPSSGYAYSRIQRQVSRVARAVAEGRPLPQRIVPERIGVLDEIFLHALDAEPERFPEIFRRMVEVVPGDTFARFMTDLSTPLDEARIIAALPKAPFLAAAARSGQLRAARSLARLPRQVGQEA